MKQQFIDDGFIILKGIIEGDLLKRIQDQCEHLSDLRDQGKTSCPQREQNVLQPEFFHRSYIEFMNNERMNDFVYDLLGKENAIFVGLSILLGYDTEAIISWHHDILGPRDLSPEWICRQEQILQANFAAFSDKALWIVPGSHCRLNTAEENAHIEKYKDVPLISKKDEFKALGGDVVRDMPGAVNVELDAGDIVIYNNLLWHCAEYDPKIKRGAIHPDWLHTKIFEDFPNIRQGLNGHPWLLDNEFMGELGPHFGHQVDLFLKQREKYKDECKDTE